MGHRPIIAVTVFLFYLSFFTVYSSFVLIADIYDDVIVESLELLTVQTSTDAWNAPDANFYLSIYRKIKSNESETEPISQNMCLISCWRCLN